jgi:phospholipid transport system substrate-binding protein
MERRPARRRGRAVMLVCCGLWIAAAGIDVRVVAAAESADTASAFLQAYSDRSIGMLTEADVDQREREARFRELLVEGFDLPSIGAFVLGRYVRVATQDQRRAFLDVFQEAMAQRFVPLFSKHPNERLQVVREYRSEADPRSTFIRSRITQPAESPIKVDWRIRKRDGQFKIIDVIIEGVSMVVTLRSEYTSVIARNDGRVGALIEMLRKRVSEGAFAPDRQSGNLLD